MSIYITTEETADIPSQYIAENTAIMPMCYNVCGQDYNGTDKRLTPKEFYDICRQAQTKEDLPNTSMITSFQAQEFFRPILKSGHDIIHIGFSNKLSGMFDQICMAQKELANEFPDRKITIIDSKLASFVEGLLYYYVCQKRESGADYDQIVAYAEEMKDKCGARFLVDDMKHLYRTGRASKTQAFLGEKLQIKPVLYLNGNGQLIPIAKCMSRKKAVKQLITMVMDDIDTTQEQKLIAVGHADCSDDAQQVIKTLKDKLKNDNIILYDVGPVIGSHVGAGMLSVIYLAKSRWVSHDSSERE